MKGKRNRKLLEAKECFPKSDHRRERLKIDRLERDRTPEILDVKKVRISRGCLFFMFSRTKIGINC